MLLIWRWICFYPARPENTEENQPITNLKPQTFANTTVTGKKVKDSSEDYFCPQIYMIQAELSNNHQTKHFSVNCSKLFANVNICRFLHAALWFNQQGCNEGKRGAITPAPNHSGGAEICGGAEWLLGRQKIPTMSHVHSSIQYICFRKTSGSIWGRQTCYLTRAPSNLVTPLAVIQNSSALSMYMKWGVAQLHIYVGYISLS